MDHTDFSVELSTDSVDALPEAFTDATQLDPANRAAELTEVHVAAGMIGSDPAVLVTRPGRREREAIVVSLFGTVPDAMFGQVSARHPAGSGFSERFKNIAGPMSVTSTGIVDGIVAGADTPVEPQPGERQSGLFLEPPVRQNAPARSRSYERRRPGSVGGVRTRVLPTRTVDALSPSSITTKTVDALSPPSLTTTNTPGIAPRSKPQLQRSTTLDVAGARVTRIGHEILIDLRHAQVADIAERTQNVQGAESNGRPNRGELASPMSRSARFSKQAQPNSSKREPSGYFDGLSYRDVDVDDQNRASTLPGEKRADKWAKRSRPIRRQPSMRVRLEERTGLPARFFGPLVVAGVALCAGGVLFSPLLSLHRVEVRRAGAAEPRIREAAGLHSGVPLVSLDMANIYHRIIALPEVSAAKVERKWPRGVKITVVTRTPVIALDDAGRIALVASDGTVLRDGVLDFSGPTKTKTVTDDGVVYPAISVGPVPQIGGEVAGSAKRAVELASALDPDLRDRLVTITMVGNDLSASLSSAGKVRNLSVQFGDSNELMLKTRALGALLAAGSASNVIAIDLTVPDAPVLRLVGTKASISR